jgi:Domain of unknown function (DUF4157)
MPRDASKPPEVLAQLAENRALRAPGPWSRFDFSRIPVRSGAAVATRPDLTPAGNAELLDGGLRRRIGSGMPLPAGLRAEAESRFGADFGQVRVHDNPAAHRLARQQSAQAFTIGSDIVFHEDHYRPASQAGRRLLAHELAHVLQQRHGAAGASASLAHEDAAESSARAVLGGNGPVHVGPPAAVGVQRQPLPSVPAATPTAGPDIAAVAAEIDAELAEIEPLVTRLSAGVTANPADYALNEVRGTMMRLDGDLQVATQFAARADAPPSISSAAARFQALRTSFAAVAATAQHWHDDNPAGESLGMWNERQGAWLAGAGARQWEKGGGHTLLSGLAYTGAGVVALVEAVEQVLSFGFHDAATAVSQAYTRGDISWNEGIRIARSAAWRAILTAAVTRGAGAATGRLGALAARGVGLAPTAVGYGWAAGGVTAGLSSATSLATQSLLTSALQQHFASPAARAIWMQGMPSGKDWAVAIPLSVILGGASGARAVQVNNAKLIGSMIDTPRGRLKVIAITPSGQMILRPPSLRAAPPAPPPAVIDLVYDPDTGSWRAPQAAAGALPPGPQPQGAVGLLPTGPQPQGGAGALVPAPQPRGALTAGTKPISMAPVGTQALPSALSTLRLAAPLSATPAGEEIWAQITDDLSLEAASAQPGGAAPAAAEAESSGLIGPRGAPGQADVAVQTHGAASEVRAQYGVSGADVQSAHLGPTSYLRSLTGYSRSGALTTLLDHKVHTALDNYWKAWSIQQRQAGRTSVSAQELNNVMVDAINQTPGLAQRVKNTLSWRLHIELFQELALKPTDPIPLPYPNVPPR